MSSKPVRNISMDILRCLAFLFVICVHFLSNIGFYDQPMIGERMLVMTIMRNFFSICVPLFLLLSGYFMSRKPVSEGHYKKLTKTIAVYLLASLACVLYKMLYLKQELDVQNFLRGFFIFGHAGYSWYINMYIGLFLLCPFLNLIYNNLENKKKKQLLISTMLFLTAIPYVVNIFIPDLEWFANPASSARYFPLIPSYWTALYPITYYFIGCYLREFPYKFKKRYLVIANIVFALLNGCFNFYRSHGVEYIMGEWQSNGSLLILIQAVLFFELFDGLDCSKIPTPISKLIVKISEVTLGAYLVSQIFDDFFYKYLKEAVSEVIYRLNWFPVMVVLVAVCALLLSGVINLIYNIIAKIVGYVKSKIPQKS